MAIDPTDISQCRSCGATASDLSAEGWQKRYDDGKTGWDRGAANPMLSKWIDGGMLQPCRVLVPGSGRGHEVILLAAAGFEVTAVDFAPSAVDYLRTERVHRGLDATVVQSDLFAYSQTHRFDAIYEQTCLCAIDPSQWETYQQLLACWLRPGGQLMAMFMQSNQYDSPPFSCDLAAMRSLFGAPGWGWISDPVQVQHPTGMHEWGCVLSRQETE